MEVSQKCKAETCVYKYHSNVKMMRYYCCVCCRKGLRGHGPLCQKVSIIDLYLLKAADVLINKIVLLVESDSDGGKRHYRFADVIRQNGYYWLESINFILNNDRFKGTILRDYLDMCPDNNKKKSSACEENYLRILSDIVKTKVKNNQFVLPDKNELVLHLRIGDYIYLKRRFLKQDYIKLIRDWCLKHPSINKITICTAFHYGNNVTNKKWLYTDEKHRQNISRLRILFAEILTNINLPVDIKSSNNPDDDFVYMLEATHFIKDAGQFSKLINDIRTIRT